MQTVTFKIPEELLKDLEKAAQETERSKSYLIRKAIASYLEDLLNYRDAMKVLRQNNPTFSLEEVERECSLIPKTGKRNKYEN